MTYTPKQMVDNPIKFKNESKPLYTWKIDSNKSMHPHRFITHGFTSQEDRINEALEKNKFLQTEPIQRSSVYCFRPTDSKKDNFPNRSQHSLSNDKLKLAYSLTDSRTSLPDLFQKTHFKAVVSLAMQIGCLKKGKNIKTKDMDYEDAISRVREANKIPQQSRAPSGEIPQLDKKKILNSLMHSSKLKSENNQRPEKLAEYILVACNVIKERSKKRSKMRTPVMISERGKISHRSEPPKEITKQIKEYDDISEQQQQEAEE